jgi:hypothetical protein
MQNWRSYESPLGARSYMRQSFVTLNSPVSPGHTRDYFHTHGSDRPFVSFVHTNTPQQGATVPDCDDTNPTVKVALLNLWVVILNMLTIISGSPSRMQP